MWRSQASRMRSSVIVGWVFIASPSRRITRIAQTLHLACDFVGATAAHSCRRGSADTARQRRDAPASPAGVDLGPVISFTPSVDDRLKPGDENRLVSASPSCRSFRTDFVEHDLRRSSRCLVVMCVRHEDVALGSLEWKYYPQDQRISLVTLQSVEPATDLVQRQPELGGGQDRIAFLDSLLDRFDPRPYPVDRCPIACCSADRPLKIPGGCRYHPLQPDHHIDQHCRDGR